MSRDPNAGRPADPKSLHKYLYAGGDPVNAADPMGRAELIEAGIELGVHEADTIHFGQSISQCIGTALQSIASFLDAINQGDAVPEKSSNTGQRLEECSLDALKTIFGPILESQF